MQAPAPFRGHRRATPGDAPPFGSSAVPNNMERPVPSFQAFVQSVAPVPRATGAPARLIKRCASSVYSARPLSAVAPADIMPTSPRAATQFRPPLQVNASVQRPGVSPSCSSARPDSPPLPSLYFSSDHSPPDDDIFSPLDSVVGLSPLGPYGGTSFLEDADDSDADRPGRLFDTIRANRPTSSSSESSQDSTSTAQTEASLHDQPPCDDGKHAPSDTGDGRGGIVAFSSQTRQDSLEWWNKHPQSERQVRRRSSAPLLMSQERRERISPSACGGAAKALPELPRLLVSPSDDVPPQVVKSALLPRTHSTASDSAAASSKELGPGKLSPRRLFVNATPALFKPRPIQKKASSGELTCPVQLQPPESPGRSTGITAMLGSLTEKRSASAKAEDRRTRDEARRERMREELKASIKLVGETDPTRV